MTFLGVALGVVVMVALIMPETFGGHIGTIVNAYEASRKSKEPNNEG